MHKCKKVNAKRELPSQDFHQLTFIAKLAISRKESRESLFWLRLIAAKRLFDPTVVADDISEARQLTAIFRAIIVKARSSAQRG
jgi:hypothetical protein